MVSSSKSPFATKKQVPSGMMDVAALSPSRDVHNESFRSSEDEGEWWDGNAPAAKQSREGHDTVTVELPKTSAGDGDAKEKKKDKKKKRLTKVKASDMGSLDSSKIRIKGRGSMDQKDLDEALRSFQAQQEQQERGRRSSESVASVRSKSKSRTSRGREEESESGASVRSKSKSRASRGQEEEGEKRRGRSRSRVRSSARDGGEDESSKSRTTRDKSRTRQKSVGPSSRGRGDGQEEVKEPQGRRSRSVARKRDGGEEEERQHLLTTVPVPPSTGSESGASRGRQRSKSLGRGLADKKTSSPVENDENDEPRRKSLVPAPMRRRSNDTDTGSSEGGKQRSKSLGRGRPDEKDKVRGRGRSVSRTAQEDESDRPRLKQNAKEQSPDGSLVKKKVVEEQRGRKARSKSIGRSSNGKSSGGDAPPPKLWDHGRQRSKSIGPRRVRKEEDEFMKLAQSSLGRGSTFFDQTLDSDEEDKDVERARRHFKKYGTTVPTENQKLALDSIVMCDDTDSEAQTPNSTPHSERKQFKEDRPSADSIPWETFLHVAETSSRSFGVR